MSDNKLPDATRVAPTGKPLQRITWDEKVKDKYAWFKNNADYFIGLSHFNLSPSTVQGTNRDIGRLYSIYNNQFPLEWFTHIIDPLSATDPKNRVYPAKVRPTSILRTNIDLLLGEYPKRPYVYQVVNMGEDAYNSYLEGLNGAVQKNISEHFLAMAQQNMKAAGHDVPEIPQQEEIPLPEEIKDRFTSSYKDNLARRGQRWIKRAIREYNVRQKQLKMFKDWLIAGETISYKNIEHGNLVYERISALEFACDLTTDFIEDGEWTIRKTLKTVSAIVDDYYDELKDADHESLERMNQWGTPFNFYNYLSNTQNRFDATTGMIPVYHITWKGKKQIIYGTYTDPFTGDTEEMQLDEDTPIDDTIQVTKKEWINEVYEVTRISTDVYCRMRAIPVQRNEMNNFSKCKLPYNGRKYSNTHAANVSVLEMGIPYAIMYMITNFILEKTIAKSKGKIALIEQNSIPQSNGWNDEKFFYYADALGYAVINRNQMGADKSFNQYSVLDMSLFGDIKNLIELRDSFSNDWDKLLGMSPQRKAQTNSSDGLGTTQTNLFQSSLMTDMIFTLFEEFTEKELQGLLDYSRFVNVDGVRAIYNEDDFDRQLLEIDPNSYSSAELGLFITHSAEEQQILNQYKNQTQAMIQNGVKQSTILEIQRSGNVAELIGKIKRVEEIEMQQSLQNQKSEQNHEMEIEQIREKYASVQSMLKIDEINAEWDRKDSNTMIKGEYDVYSAANLKGDGDADNNGILDTIEISKRVIAQQKILSEERKTNAEIAHRDKIHKDNMVLADKQLVLERDKLASKEKTEKIKAAATRSKSK